VVGNRLLVQFILPTLKRALGLDYLAVGIGQAIGPAHDQQLVKAILVTLIVGRLKVIPQTIVPMNFHSVSSGEK